MSFLQQAPELENSFDSDPLLASYVRWAVPPEHQRQVVGRLREMGELAAGELAELQRTDRLSEPEWVAWDAWGKRLDLIRPTVVWQRAERVAVDYGLVSIAYERPYDVASRVAQMALAYLFIPSSDMYGCPLAMTDGAARTLLDRAEPALSDRVVPHLLSSDPDRFWTSGQWMTETTGGSDVGRSETVARRTADGGWALYGRKWFTSAAAAQMALTLARPEGNPAGSRGLALFYVETRDGEGRPRGLRIDRLKDKLGTRKLPTAELTLDGAPAVPVAGLDNGVRAITPMLSNTRMWNAVTAAAYMRRGLTLAIDYARRRTAFGSLLIDQPLHAATLARLLAEAEGAFHLAFEVVRTVDRVEAGQATAAETLRLRALTPIAKLLTAKQAVAVLSEVVESFGGAGYVEDTGIPVLLRDAQVLPIWEGTTNVLSLDLLRALAEPGTAAALRELLIEPAALDDPQLAQAVAVAAELFDEALRQLSDLQVDDAAAAEASARQFAMTVGRTLTFMLLVRHAEWAARAENDLRPRAAALRYGWNGLDRRTRNDRAVDRELLAL